MIEREGRGSVPGLKAMPRYVKCGALIGAVALAVVGVNLTISSPDCAGSFRVHYATLTGLGRDVGDHGRYCDLLAEELFDIDVAGAELGLTGAALRRRLRTDVFASDARGLDCQLSYVGSNAAETSAVLKVLMLLSGVSLSREARASRTQTVGFIHAHLADLIERRTRMEEQQPGMDDDARRRGIADLDDRIDQLNQRLEVVLEDPPEESCLDYIVRAHELSGDALRTLASRCDTSRPVSISSWPALAPSCRD